jgi:hypothetical protein
MFFVREELYLYEIRLSMVSTLFLGALAKLRKAAISVVMSVCPHGITRLPLNGF